MLSLLRKASRPRPSPLPVQTPGIDGTYQALVTLARTPAFYLPPYDVPDTLEGRFDLLALLVGTACLRMSQLGTPGSKDGEAASQSLFDLMFHHLERNFREAGVGDLSVPKQMRRMIQAFYGRNQIYAEALLQQDQTADWPAILSLNVYNQPTHASAVTLAGWLQNVWWPFLLNQSDLASMIAFSNQLKTLGKGL